MTLMMSKINSRSFPHLSSIIPKQPATTQSIALSSSIARKSAQIKASTRYRNTKNVSTRRLPPPPHLLRNPLPAPKHLDDNLHGLPPRRLVSRPQLPHRRLFSHNPPSRFPQHWVLVLDYLRPYRTHISKVARRTFGMQRLGRR